jgi:hypothetical protein
MVTPSMKKMYLKRWESKLVAGEIISVQTFKTSLQKVQEDGSKS